MNDKNSIIINGNRYLKPECVVHHIDFCRDNNNPDNLHIFNNESMHTLFHNLIGDKFQNITEFYIYYNDKYVNKILNYEWLYKAYIYYGLSINQISNIFSIPYKAIQSQIYKYHLDDIKNSNNKDNLKLIINDLKGAVNMNNFEKVSFEQYESAFNSDCNLKKEYNEIKLPKRATKGSAGYDFFSPFDFQLETGETIKIPTGIKVHIKDGLFLGILPRSGHGFKYRIQLDNTMGIIDSDYINSDNEGHIFIKITNDGHEGRRLEVKKGDAFAQGIFIPYDITDNDGADGIRNGGLGSTSSSNK